DGRGVFRGLPAGFAATRYHSLVVLEAGLPAVLEISARAEDGEIMGLRHRQYPVEGVQFHPESILTGQGKALLGNFLELTPVLASP
ncbi:MAG: glutamine amidotransferase-related protein, partial [Candidatus Rokuibacteriota bacterium]